MSGKLKTLIVIDNMNTGGIASSLYSFLFFQSSNLECDLLVFDKNSVDRNRLPDNVNIVDSSQLLKILGVSQSEIIKESAILAFIRAFLIVISRVLSGEDARRLLMLFVKQMNGYDLAISYAHDNGWKSISKGCNDYVANKVEAKTKLAYVHCDYANYGGYDNKQGNVFDRFDYIALVSESCKNSFCKMFPELKSKSIVLENFTNVELIKKLADEYSIEYDDQLYNFVSVCRLSTVKGLDRVISILYELEQEGYTNYSWTIVGEGPEYVNLVNMVHSFGLDKRILFVGNKNNPYPYIKNATALLLPSIHEAAPMVYAESAALGVPVITTETCSANELVKDRNIGIVVNNDNAHIKAKIREILCGNEILTGRNMTEEEINEFPKEEFESFLTTIRYFEKQEKYENCSKA